MLSRKIKRTSKDKNATCQANGNLPSKQQNGVEIIEDYDDSSIFCNLLKKAGVQLKASNHSNELCVEHIEFYKKLTIYLKRHENYPQVIDDFLEGVQQYIEDRSRFKQVLLPCVSTTEDISSRNKQQACLIRLLLNIDLLQPKLITLLLEKLPEFMDDEPLFECDENMNIPRQVLAQLQWLDHIEDMTALREKLLEILMVTSLDVQREIISCLPEIMDVAEHEQVVGVLKELLEQSPVLTILILETMSNLVLNKDLLAEVLASVLKTLPSCKMDDLPVVVKFILHSVNTKDAVGVFHEMRIALEFDVTLDSIISSTPVPGSSKSVNDTNQNNEILALELLTMKSIHSCLQFQKSLVAPWIKVLEQVLGAKEHKVVDVFLLLIIHSLKHTKIVESLFRNKIRSGDFTEKLLKFTFSRHASVMQEYFSSVLSLALAFICSSETAIQHFACILYKNAFENLDRFCRQEIVGNLVTHIGSGMTNEMDTALDILVDLSESCLDQIAPFAIFVKGLLDYTDQLKMSQIRKVYFAISKLAFHSDKDGGRTKNELHIVIRKQLMSNKLRYKQNGIIGGIMLIKSVISSSDLNVTPEILTDVLGLLELMNTSSKNMPKAHSLFMDELSSMIHQTTLHQKVLEWLSDKVINDFQDNYVVDLDKNFLTRNSFMPLDFQFGLDEDVGENIALKILPLFENADGEQTKNIFEDDDSGKISPLCIVPTFRLLALCESQRDETLEDIMALLGCPVCIMKSHVFDKFDCLSRSEKEVVCAVLFYTLNWFREVINLFSSQKEPEVLVKVIMRLQHITEVQTILEKCLAATPGYVPPLACFDVDETEIIPPSTDNVASTSSTGKRGKKTTKRKKGDKGAEDTCDNTLADLENSEVNSHSEATKDSSEIGINLDNYYQYFREIHLNVMDILLVGPITSKSLDTQMNTECLQDVKVQPPQVEFLLKDLNRKLKHSLPTSATKKFCFARVTRNEDIGITLLNQKSPTEIVQKIITLLPALCQQLEGSSAFFQALVASNDGILDGPGHTTPEFQRAALCFQLLIEIFHSLFSWKDLTLPANSALLTSILSVIAGRIKANTNTNLSLQESFNLTVNYMYNFGNTIPNIQAAVKLTELLVTLTEKRTNEEKHKPAELAEIFLQRTWLNSVGQPEKGAKFNKQIQIILKYFISLSKNPLDAIGKLTNDAIPELLDSSQKASYIYPTLTVSTFPTFYRVAFAELVAVVKTISAGKKDESYEIRKEKILQWNWAVRIFHVLITFTKKFDALVNIGTVLKTGRVFVDAFTIQAMPLLDQIYRSQYENIQALLKSMQLSTRSLHHICGHSKIVKSVLLTNQIPLVKKSLEQLMLRVKEMLSINKCEEGYMIGILKNRDLMGEEIRSQSNSVSPADQEAEPEEEDEVMSEEEEEQLSDVEMEEADKKVDSNEEEQNESYSEVY